MKNLIFRYKAMIFIVMVASCSISVNAASSIPRDADVASKPAEALNPEVLITRLNEIKSMDLATMKPAERKELRKEVRAIRDQVRAAENQGIYLSVGAVILIILLLILIL